MRDFQELFENLDQRAVGTIVVDDYTALVGVASEGTVEVTDYTGLVGVQATGTIDIDDYLLLIEASATATVVVDDYTLLNEAQATGTFTVVDYSQLEGVTVTVNGQDYVEGVHFDAVTSNNQTATNLATAINGAEAVGASPSSAVVTITATTAGTAGNSIDISSDGGANLTASGAFLTGGRDYASITVDGVQYVAGTDFTAETDDGTTATNLASAIDAGANVGAGAVGDTVTITASTAGSAGNSIAIANTASAGAWTVSGTFLTGGQDHAQFDVDGNVLVQGTDFTASTSNDATATSLASAIDAISGVGASASTNQVTITNTAVGVAGNAKVTTYTGTAGGATVSGATLSGGVDHGTITVGVDTITQGTDFTASTSNDATATSIASAIDALSGVGASAVGAVVTVTNDALGVAGDSKALTTNASGSLTLSGATLEGGVDPATITVGADTITEQTDFNAQTDNGTTATNIASALDGISGLSASADGATVTVYATAPGTAGNSKVLQSNVSGAGVTLSGATLLGGVDATYSEIFDYGQAGDIEEVEEILNLTAKTGTITCDVTPQYSQDKVTFFDATAFAQLSAVGSETINRTTTGLYTRYKIVLGGTDPIVTLKINAVAK